MAVEEAQSEEHKYIQCIFPQVFEEDSPGDLTRDISNLTLENTEKDVTKEGEEETEDNSLQITQEGTTEETEEVEIEFDDIEGEVDEDSMFHTVEGTYTLYTATRMRTVVAVETKKAVDDVVM